MKKTIITIAALLLSFYGYCQNRFMNAYSRLAPEKYANMTGSLDVDSMSNLVLYLGKDVFEIYPKVWDKDNIVIIKDGKKIKLKRKDLKKYNNLIVNQIDGQIVITVNDEESCVVYCNPTRKAEEFIEKNSIRSHTSHTSHYSAFHGSHASHASHSSHYSSY